MESLIGTTLGGYKLIRAIGSGGMGTVYLAEDQGVGQQVAIKLVRADDSDFADRLSTERTMERFKQEARAIARLDHLHVLPLYRYGEEKVLDSMRAYMVMQYRPEGSLWDWLRKRAGQALGEQSQISNPGFTTPLPAGLPTNWPLSVTEAADYLQQASSALQYAHEHGIVHRDVKPANFLLRFDCNHATNTTTAFLLLSDFGLAKSFSTDSSTSILLGTPMYMAPEQFYGNAGPECDQYALAVMVYYLLTGRPLFMGDPATMMHQHLTVAPLPIRSLVPELSFGVEAVLNRALAKQIQDRYPTIAAFSEDFLQRMHDGPSRPLILGRYTDGGSVAPTVAAPAGVPPLVVQPQSAGNRSPSSATFTPLPPTSYMSSPGNSTPMIPPMPPTMQSWHQDATVQQIGQIPKPPPSISQGKVSRRGVVGWIVGGAAVLGLGVIASVALSANQQAAHTQTQNTNGPNPQQTPQAGTARYVLKGHSDEVHSISWSPAGDQLASGSLDATVRVWDAATQQTVQTYTGHTQGVEAVAWGQNDQSDLIASGGRDWSVRIWNNAEQARTPPRNLGSTVNTLAWMANDAGILAGTDEGLQEVSVNKKSVTPLALRGEISAIALSSDDRYLAVAFERGTVVVSSIADEEGIVYTYGSRGAKQIFGLSWSASNLLAIGGSDQTVAVVDITSRSVVNNHTTQSTVHGLSWEPNGSGRLAIALDDTTVSIWNTTNDTVISRTGHTGPVRSVAWGSQYLASASADKTIILWKV